MGAVFCELLTDTTQAANLEPVPKVAVLRFQFGSGT
jgi:hypothetical protein